MASRVYLFFSSVFLLFPPISVLFFFSICFLFLLNLIFFVFFFSLSLVWFVFYYFLILFSLFLFLILFCCFCIFLLVLALCSSPPYFIVSLRFASFLSRISSILLFLPCFLFLSSLSISIFIYVFLISPSSFRLSLNSLSLYLQVFVVLLPSSCFFLRVFASKFPPGPGPLPFLSLFLLVLQVFKSFISLSVLHIFSTHTSANSLFLSFLRSLFLLPSLLFPCFSLLSPRFCNLYFLPLLFSLPRYFSTSLVFRFHNFTVSISLPYHHFPPISLRSLKFRNKLTPSFLPSPTSPSLPHSPFPSKIYFPL